MGIPTKEELDKAYQQAQFGSEIPDHMITCLGTLRVSPFIMVLDEEHRKQFMEDVRKYPDHAICHLWSDGTFLIEEQNEPEQPQSPRAVRRPPILRIRS